MCIFRFQWSLLWEVKMFRSFYHLALFDSFLVIFYNFLMGDATPIPVCLFVFCVNCVPKILDASTVGPV